MAVKFNVNIKSFRAFHVFLFNIFVLGVSSPLRRQATLGSCILSVLPSLAAFSRLKKGLVNKDTTQIGSWSLIGQ